MQFINTLSYYINMIGIITLITVALVVAVLYYLIKVKKVVARAENIDTSHFKREDSVSYAPFKDIVSRDGGLDSDGMIVVSDTCFVGGISVRGFDYAAGSSDERIAAQVNSVNFFNVVEKLTSFRQSIRAIDLSANIEEYESKIKKFGRELLELDTEYQLTLSASTEYEDDPENYVFYAKRMDELKVAISAKRHMVDECEAVVRYMKAMTEDSGRGGASGQRTNQIMFSYIYNEDEYIEPLSKEEIYVRAMEELSATARAYGDALAACHFRSKRLTARELIGLMRKHTSPITGESLDLDELLDSSYTSLFVTSDSLVEAFKEKIGEEIYNRHVAEYERRVEADAKRQEDERLLSGNQLINEAYDKAMAELGLEE